MSRSGNSSTAVATFGLYQGTTPCNLGRRSEGIAVGNSSTAVTSHDLYKGTTPCGLGRRRINDGGSKPPPYNTQ